MIEVKIGPTPAHCQVLMDGKDVTQELCIKALSFRACADSGKTTLTLECYVEKIEGEFDTIEIKQVME